MKKPLIWLLVIALVISLSFIGIGCEKEGAAAEEEVVVEEEEVTPPAEEEEEEEVTVAAEGEEEYVVTEMNPNGDPEIFQPIIIDGVEVLPISEGNIGPNGNTPSTLEDIRAVITDEVAEKVRNGNFTAAICMHALALDFAQLSVRGIKQVLEEYNVEVLGVTDAYWDVEKQVGDLESLIQLKPDIIVGFTLDVDTMAPGYKEAEAAGILLTFIDSIPTGFKEDEYASVALGDNYSMGWNAGKMLVDVVGKDADIGMIEFNVSMFHTDMRARAMLDYFESEGIELVDHQRCDDAIDAAAVVEQWLVAYPNLKGVATTWDGFAMPAVGVIDNAGKDIKVTGCDLSDDSAFALVSGGTLVGIAAQHPYDQGLAEGLAAIATLGGVPYTEIPPYIVVPNENAKKETMGRSYYRVCRREMPDEIARYVELIGD